MNRIYRIYNTGFSYLNNIYVLVIGNEEDTLYLSKTFTILEYMYTEPLRMSTERLSMYTGPLRMSTERLSMYTEPLRMHTERLSIYTEPLRMHTERLSMFTNRQVRFLYFVHPMIHDRLPKTILAVPTVSHFLPTIVAIDQENAAKIIMTPK